MKLVPRRVVQTYENRPHNIVIPHGRGFISTNNLPTSERVTYWEWLGRCWFRRSKSWYIE